MKTLTKMLTIAFASMSILSACQQEESIQQSIDGTKERINFKSTQDFLDTYLAVANLNYEEQKLWIDSTKIEEPLFYNIENCQDESMQEAPIAWQILFNKNMEAQINDTLVAYKEGVVYATAVKGKALPTPITIATINTSSNYEDSNTRASVTGGWVNKGTGWFAQRYHEIPLASGWRHRYVHEFRTVCITSGYATIQQLFFDIKFQYKKHKGWRQAGTETRTVEIRNLRFVVSHIQNGSPILLNQTIKTTQPLQFPICYVKMNTPDGIPFQNKWSVQCTGQITHTVEGRPDSKVVDNW